MMFRRVILKSILLVSIIGFSLSLHANQYTSIGNGNWSNVLIWSPFGFPLPTDTVVINSNVTLDSDWGITGAGIITINTGATLTEDIPGRVFFQAGGDLINNGTFNFSNFWLDSGQVYNNDSARFDQNFFIDEAGIFINNGVIANVDSAWNNGVFSNADPNSELICAFFYNTDSLFNDGSIGFLEGANEGVLENTGLIASVAFINDGEFENGIGGSFSAVDFWNDWKFVNLGNASVTVTRDFLNGDTLVPLSGPMLYNDGSFNVGRHFYNGDSIIGVTGQFCIGEYSLNYGYVGGSIDICDNTGSPSFDTNLGFVGPSVTSCASSCSMVVSVVENDVTCSGGTDGSVVLSVYGGSGSYTYLWNTGDSTDSIGGLTEGTYVVLITDGIDTSYVVANLKAPPVLYTINATTESTCDAENGTAAVTAFGGSPPYKYSWDDPNSQSNALATGLAVGSYSVTVSDIDSCFITELLVVLNKPGITVNTIITKPSCIVDSNGTIDITVTGGAPPYNYLWSPDVSTDSIGIDIGIGDYVITITDVDSCEVVNNVTVTAAGGADCDVKADAEWKIFSGITPDGDGIDDVWEIRGLKQFDAVTVQIFTNRGVVVWSSDNYENDFEGKDDNDNLLMPGVYYYVVTRTEAVDKGWLHIKR